MYQSSRRRLSGWHALCAGRHLFSRVLHRQPTKSLLHVWMNTDGNLRTIFYTYPWTLCVSTNSFLKSGHLDFELTPMREWVGVRSNVAPGGFLVKRWSFGWCIHLFWIWCHILKFWYHILEVWCHLYLNLGANFLKLCHFEGCGGGCVGRSPGPPKRFLHRCREEAFCPTLAFLYIYTFIHTNKISSIPIHTHELSSIHDLVYTPTNSSVHNPTDFLFSIPQILFIHTHELL